MNRIKNILLGLILLFCAMVGCTGINSSKKETIINQDHFDTTESSLADKAIFDVINNQVEFISVNEGCQLFYWNNYNFLNNGIYDFSGLEKTFAISDIDLDGENELFVTVYGIDIIVFDYQDGFVYGYQFPSRAFIPMKDGICSSSSAANVCGWYNIAFEKENIEIKYLAEVDSGVYYFDKEEVSEEDFMRLTKEFREKESVQFYEYSVSEIQSSLNILQVSQNGEDLSDGLSSAIPSEYKNTIFKEESFSIYYGDSSSDGKIIGNLLNFEEKTYRIIYASVVDILNDEASEIVLYLDEYAGVLVLTNTDNGVEAIFLDEFEQKRFLDNGCIIEGRISIRDGKQDIKRLGEESICYQITNYNQGKYSVEEIRDSDSNIVKYYSF